MNESGGGGGPSDIKYARNVTRKGTPEMVFRRVEVLPQQNSNQIIFSNIQQIKDIYLQDTEKVSKEKIETSVLGFASPSDSLQMSPTLSTLVSDDTLLNLHPSESIGGLSRRLNLIQNQDESSSSTCDISELNATITPVNLIQESEGIMLVGPPNIKDVFSVPKPLYKDSPPQIKDSKDCGTTVISSNRLLDKLIQNCKPESNFTLPLRVSEFSKLPHMGLKPNFSYAKSPEVIYSAVSYASSPMSTEIPRQQMRPMDTLKNSFVIGNPATMTAAMTYQDTQNCMAMNSQMQYSQAVLPGNSQVSTRDVFLNANCVVSPSHSRNSILSTVEHNSLKRFSDCKNTYHAETINKRSTNESMLLPPETMFTVGPISSSSNDSSQNLNFINDASMISQINELASQSTKDARTFRQVDIMLSQMPNGENVLNLGPLTNSLSTDICQQPNSSVEQALNVGLAIEQNHLALLPSSPLLNNISGDFLDNNSVISKNSPGQQTFLPNLSTTTDLALSFSTNFLENSNMSIDMGSLSEGEGSLNVSHGFVESLEPLIDRKPNSQLNFTNALKDAADKYDSVKLKILAENLDAREPKSLCDNPENKLAGTQIFRNDTANSKRRKVSTVKARSVNEPARQKEIIPRMEDKPVVQQVQCLKCSVCSFLTLDEAEMFVHMKSSHYKVDQQNVLNPRISINATKPQQELKKEQLPVSEGQMTLRNQKSNYVDSNSNDHDGSDSSEADVKDDLYVPNDDDTNGSNSTTEEPATTHQIPLIKKSNPEPFYKCGIKGCTISMKKKENLEYHRKCHSSAFLMCPECNNKFVHWAILAMHLWKEHYIDMDLHSCELCNYKSYSYTKLVNNHKSTHSNDRPFLCDICGKDFKTAKQLRSHKTLHQEKKKESMDKCHMCNREFCEKRMLLSHMEAVHNKVKPYLCNFCGKSFASKSTLILHIRKHTGEKPFSCDKCNYCTSDHNSMRRHKMKHSNDKRYSCPYCKYSSIQSSTFKVHLKRKHDAQAQKDGLIFTCTICTFKTVKRDNFLAHVAIHRKDSVIPAEDIISPPVEEVVPPSNEKANPKKRKRPAKVTVDESAPTSPKVEVPVATQNHNQCPPTYFVVQMPQMVNINWDSAETVELSTNSGVINGIILPTRSLASQVMQVGSVDEFDSSIMQQVELNNGFVQLTPEVVAMPIASNKEPSPSSSLPVILYDSAEQEK